MRVLVRFLLIVARPRRRLLMTSPSPTCCPPNQAHDASTWDRVAGSVTLDTPGLEGNGDFPPLNSPCDGLRLFEDEVKQTFFLSSPDHLGRSRH